MFGFRDAHLLYSHVYCVLCSANVTIRLLLIHYCHYRTPGESNDVPPELGRAFHANGHGRRRRDRRSTKSSPRKMWASKEVCGFPREAPHLQRSCHLQKANDRDLSRGTDRLSQLRGSLRFARLVLQAKVNTGARINRPANW